MHPQERVPLPGTEYRRPADARVSNVDPDEEATVTLYLRPSAALPADSARMTREDLQSSHGASEPDVAAVRTFADQHGLTVTAVDPGGRTVKLTGRLSDLGAAFGAMMDVYTAADGSTYRAVRGSLSANAGLAQVVTGVFGLDQRPHAQPRLRRVARAAPDTTYTPPQVAEAYAFPPGTDGSGQCIGLLELGGGYRGPDLAAYFSTLGLPAPAVTFVSVDGGTNSPGSPSGPDAEVMLDIEVAGSVAPGARLVVYFAPNTDQGFVDAVTAAVHDTTNRPSVLSISWGAPESQWTTQAMTTLEDAFSTAAAVGMTVTVAAGDSGSSDGESDGQPHVDFPASAPHALGCGGTRLAASGAAIQSETVWNDQSAGGGATGGGTSAVFSTPAWQARAGVPPRATATDKPGGPGAPPAPTGTGGSGPLAPAGRGGRGVPDVAGDADPATGYEVRVDGQTETIGGTSAVAPLWAALVARLNQALGRDLGYLNPQLYALGLPGGARPDAFHDITSGDNGAYQAGPGWDPCTGLGTPDGAALLSALGGPAAS